MAQASWGEALDRTMKNLRNNQNRFGGAMSLLEGNFAQTLRLIPRSTTAGEFNACLKSSILWKNIEIINLSKNMPVELQNDRSGEISLKQPIGNSKIPEDVLAGCITCSVNFCQFTKSNTEFIQKLLTDGITNKLVSCKPKDQDITDTVLVRVYGNKTDLLIDRSAETRNILHLNKLGLAPDLYATFDNGLVYQFVPGSTLTDKAVILPEIYELVAKKLAKLHKVKVSGTDKPQPFLWDKIKKFLNLVPDVFTDMNIDNKYRELVAPKTHIINEIECMKEILTKLNSPIVFSHNDLLLGNVIYTKEKHCVTFIDYEYAAFNYQAFDIGNHFAEFAGVEVLDYNRYPDKDLQLKWLKIYLLEYQGYATEEDIEKLYVEVNQFALMSHLFWGVWALIQAEYSYIKFDFIDYAAQRFNEYYRKKTKFLSLKY